MMPRPARRFFAPRWRAGLALVVVAVMPSPGGAQPAAASKLKAAFTLNFIKFTEWPDLKPQLPILVCVIAEAGIEDAMTEAVGGQSVGNHRIEAIPIAPDAPLRDCQVLFVSERQPRLAAILEAARRLPMLIVSDVEQSARQGAVIELFREGDRLRFAINIDALERSRLKVSSRLLSLAKIVRDADPP